MWFKSWLVYLMISSVRDRVRDLHLAKNFLQPKLALSSYHTVFDLFLTKRVIVRLTIDR